MPASFACVSWICQLSGSQQQPSPNFFLSPEYLHFALQGARGFPGTPGLPGVKGHRVSIMDWVRVLESRGYPEERNHFGVWTLFPVWVSRCVMEASSRFPGLPRPRWC